MVLRFIRCLAWATLLALVALRVDARNACDGPLSDEHLQRAADNLLAAADPALPENSYFPEYARDKLRWMTKEHAAGRLTIAFLEDPARIRLPIGVLMAASHLDGHPTIFIVKPYFATWLQERGRTAPPFSEQQRNDFAIGLIHEIIHLQNPHANPRDPKSLVREESRAWREVALRVIRPLRSLKRPLSRKLLEVDDALRSCSDEVPCDRLGRLVRLAR